MKVIIAGSRYGRPNRELADAIAASGFVVTEIVHGAAPGVDEQADAWARSADIPVARFPAPWKTVGKAAGPIRNRAMAKYADALIALSGGDGTSSMIREAQKAGLEIYIHNPTKATDGTCIR